MCGIDTVKTMTDSYMHPLAKFPRHSAGSGEKVAEGKAQVGGTFHSKVQHMEISYRRLDARSTHRRGMVPSSGGGVLL